MNMLYDIRFENFIFKHALDVHPIVPRENYVEHFHTAYELLLFLQGGGEFTMRHNKYILRPYNMLFIQPGEHHYIDLEPDTDYERIVVRFEAADIPPMILKKLAGTQSVYRAKGTRIAEEFMRLDTYCSELHEDVLPIVLRSSLNVILSYLGDENATEQTPEYTNETLLYVLDYISDHLTEITGLEELSKSLHMSQSSISRLFYNELRVPIMSYIRTQKCMRARTMLNSGVPATKAYLLCGFNDYSSFYRAYVKVFKNPPSQRMPEITLHS